MRFAIIALLAALTFVPALQAQEKISGVKALTPFDAQDLPTPTSVACGIAYVQWYKDGIVFGPRLTTAPYTLQWDTKLVPDGSYKIKAAAADKSGGPNPLAGKECDGSLPNIGWSDETVYEVDNVKPDTNPPTITITAPKTASVSGNRVQISAAASDGEGSVSWMELWIANRLSSSSKTDRLSFTWNSNPDKGRSVSMLVRAFDESGNAGEQSMTFQVRR